jgi:hypothetical protein
MLTANSLEQLFMTGEELNELLNLGNVLMNQFSISKIREVQALRPFSLKNRAT